MVHKILFRKPVKTSSGHLGRFMRRAFRIRGSPSDKYTSPSSVIEAEVSGLQVEKLGNDDVIAVHDQINQADTIKSCTVQHYQCTLRKLNQKMYQNHELSPCLRVCSS